MFLNKHEFVLFNSYVVKSTFFSDTEPPLCNCYMKTVSDEACCWSESNCIVRSSTTNVPEHVLKPNTILVVEVRLLPVYEHDITSLLVVTFATKPANPVLL